MEIIESAWLQGGFALIAIVGFVYALRYLISDKKSTALEVKEERERNQKLQEERDASNQRHKEDILLLMQDYQKSLKNMSEKYDQSLEETQRTYIDTLQNVTKEIVDAVNSLKDKVVDIGFKQDILAKDMSEIKNKR